jgi:hypothetical protein
MKDLRVMWQRSGVKGITISKMHPTIQTEEDARRAVQIKFGEDIDIMMVTDVNEEF